MERFWFSSIGTPAGQSFVGTSWEDAGFITDDDGNPTHDPNRNTVLNYSVDDLSDQDLRDDTGELYAAWAGENSSTREELEKNWKHWLLAEGFSEGAVDVAVAELCEWFEV